jgi:Mn2+/Fe2+ NRAMP family transporter
MESADGRSSWDRVLLLVVVAVAIYAVALVVAGLWLGDTVFDLLGFGPEDGNIDDSQRDYVRLVYGILGAVIVGWMMTIGAIVVGPLRRREAWAWWAIVTATAAWFVLDTGLSLVLGFVGHALFNVAFAIGLAVPLAAIKPDLQKPRT